MKKNRKICQICGLTLKIEKVIPCKGYEYFFCKECNGATLEPREKVIRDSQKKYNTKSYFSWKQKSLLKNYLNKITLSKSYFDWVSRNLKTSKKQKILDVGAGVPTFLSQMQSAGFDVFALEPSKKQSALISKHIGEDKVFNSFFENARITKETFDVLTFWHVLEHVKDLNKTLSKAKKILKKNGSIYLEVPNSNSLSWALFGDSYELLAVPEHALYFSENSLQKVFKKYGFKVKEVVYPLKYISVFSLSLSRKYKLGTLYYLSLPVGICLNFLARLMGRSEVIRMHAVKASA